VKSLSGHVPHQVMYVDAMNLLTRDYHGMSDLEYHGKKTGMLYGLSRLFIDWMRKSPSTKFIMVWEGKDSWRKIRWPIYKAKRVTRSPEESKVFWGCVDQIKEVLPIMGISQVWSHTYEADDVVWNIAQIEERKAVYSSGDWDWWPLIDYGDILYQHKNMLTTEMMQAMFAKKFNTRPVDPSRMWLFKILCGDPSDTVSGIPRFLKKVAAELCNLGGVDETTIVQGLVRLGEKKWAQKVLDHEWVLDRNLELLCPSAINQEDMEWIESEYSEAEFGEVLLKSGMENLYDRFMEVK